MPVVSARLQPGGEALRQQALPAPIDAVEQVFGGKSQRGVAFDLQFAVEEEGVGVFFAQNHAQVVGAVGGEAQVGRAGVILCGEALCVGAEADADAEVKYVKLEVTSGKLCHVGGQEAAAQHLVQGLHEDEARRQGGQVAAYAREPAR